MTSVPATYPAQPDVPDDCPLTARQYEVMYWITQGIQQNDVAKLLGISQSTIRSMTHNVYKILGVPNATTATVLFMRNGWHAEAPAEPRGDKPVDLDHSKYAGLPPFAPAYLEAFDRHLADGDDPAAARDMSVAVIGLTARKPRERDREAFLDTVIDGLLGHQNLSHGPRRRRPED